MCADYFAPTFTVELDGSRLSDDVMAHITQVRVVDELDTMNHFSLTVANPYPDMPWTHGEKTAEFFKEGKPVKIQMGYVDHMQLLFDGLITRLSPTFPASGTPMLTLEGYTHLHRLKGSPRTRTFRDKTDKEIAEEIAAPLKDIELEAEDTKTRHAYVIQYRQTDLAFLRERARRIHFELKIEDKTLKFRKAKDNQSTVYTLVWGHPREDFTLNDKLLPLQNFAPTMNTLQQVSKVIVRGHDPRTKQTIEGQAGVGDEASTMGGNQTGAQVSADALGESKEEFLTHPVASQEEADQMAQAIYQAFGAEFITGSGATIGVPDLRAGRVVELKGLGERFSGQYYLTQATHSISSSGYLTTFKARRNAVS